MDTVADHRTSETLDFTNQFVVFGRELRSQSSFPLLRSVGAFLPRRLDLRKRNSHEFIEIPQAGAWQGQRAPEPSQSARGSAASLQWMLRGLGFKSLDSLIDVAVPKNIRLDRELNLPEAKSESEALAELGAISRKNTVARSFIGAGYYDCVTPAVIQRNILENPGWYTQYTPYQPEISQGRLEALLNFQTVISELTGQKVANASLLDEGSAAAEAMHMSQTLHKGDASAFFVSLSCHPQTIEVVRTRARPLGIRVLLGDHKTFEFDVPVFGALVQYPSTDGTIYDYRDFVERAHQAGALVTVAADLLSLTLLVPPGEFGADIAVGNTQRFGVPLGYGGPHAAYFATRSACKRLVPGRIVGVSKDAHGKPALRLALQTREQHIRRDKATSNICTAQVLPAVMASMYAVYHGPAGLMKIAQHIHRFTALLAEGLRRLGYSTGPEHFFDMLRVEVPRRGLDEITEAARSHKINLRVFDENTVGVALDETASAQDLTDLFRIFAGAQEKTLPFALEDLLDEVTAELPESLARKSAYLTHPVFNRHHSETDLLRYLQRLEARDLSLTTSMIPLGSCTMKLNATAEMIPVSWPEFCKIQPFVPWGQAP